MTFDGDMTSFNQSRSCCASKQRQIFNLRFCCIYQKRKVSKLQDLIYLAYFLLCSPSSGSKKGGKSCENIDHDIIYLQLALQLFNDKKS